MNMEWNDKTKLLAKLMIPFLVAMLSIFLFSAKVPETKFVSSTIENLEKNKTTVMEFTGATIATSIAISALPDDFATPLADTLADMNKYFVFILVIIFLERLLVVEGTKIAFLFVIPIACGIYVVAALSKKKYFESFANKLMVLALALVLVVPCSTHLTNYVAADYLAYVDETIEQTKNGADKINGVTEEEEEQSSSFFSKIADAVNSVIEGVKDLADYFKDLLKRCVNSVAILIVTNFIMPILTFWIIKWLLKELFRVNLVVPKVRKLGSKSSEEEEEE